MCVCVRLLSSDAPLYRCTHKPYNPLVCLLESRKRTQQERRLNVAGAVTTEVAALGPSFIKLAQTASTRRDLLGRVLCDALAALQVSFCQHRVFPTGELGYSGIRGADGLGHRSKYISVPLLLIIRCYC